VKFNTKVYHPNIKTDTGEICADALGAWAPTQNVKGLVEIVKELLEHPSIDSPLEAEIAQLFGSDKEAYDAKAKQFTDEFAKA